jgi:hypothetical protein
MISPGCGGFFIGPTATGTPSVVVGEIDIEGSSLFEAENDASVAGHGDAPKTRQIAGKGVQPPARIQCHLTWFPDPVQDSQDASDLVGILRWHTAPITVMPQPSQPLVTEARDHGRCL